MYPVSQVYGCLQGEGAQTGVAMVMLRLQGCDVGCPWCDTKFTWKLDAKQRVSTVEEAAGQNEHYVELGAEDIAVYLRQYYGSFNWILVSGGEPARHDLKELVSALHLARYKVSIETSGTETGHVGAGFDWVTVSPKIGMPGGKLIQSAAVAEADEIKYVIGKVDDLEKLDRFLAIYTRKPACQIALQPVSLSPKATKLCIDTCMERGWRLSIQMHKLIGIE